MTAEARPWWASADGIDGVGPEPDPVAAHRAARRGARDDTAAGDVDDGPWWEPAAEAVARLARDVAAAGEVARDDLGGGHDRSDARRGAAGTSGPAGDAAGGTTAEGSGGGGGGHDPDVCGVCPICVGLRALGESRPELVAHLAAAARHVAAALRSVVDATEDPDGRRDDGFEHIDLDG